MVAKYRRASPPLSQGGDSAQHRDELREVALQGRHQPCSGEITAAGSSSEQAEGVFLCTHTYIPTATSDLKKGAQGEKNLRKVNTHTRQPRVLPVFTCVMEREFLYEQTVTGKGAAASP